MTGVNWTGRKPIRKCGVGGERLRNRQNREKTLRGYPLQTGSRRGRDKSAPGQREFTIITGGKGTSEANEHIKLRRRIAYRRKGVREKLN